MALIGDTCLTVLVFHDNHTLDTKVAIKWARGLKITQNLFHMMHICSVVVLSYLMPILIFIHRLHTNNFNHLGACCILGA